MKLSITFEQLDAFLAIKEEREDKRFHKRQNFLSEHFEKDGVLKTSGFTIETMIVFIKQYAHNFKMSYRELLGRWEIEVFLKDRNMIEVKEKELVDVLWVIVKEICDKQISSNEEELFEIAAAYNNVFSNKASVSFGQIEVNLNGGKYIIREEKEGNYTFLFTFTENEETFWQHEDNEAMVDFFIEAFSEKAKKAGQYGFILQYENLNNAIFPEDLEEKGFLRCEQQQVSLNEAKLFLNGVPSLFEQHLPRGYYIQVFQEDEKAKNFMHLIEELEQSYPKFEMNYFEDGAFLEHEGKQYNLWFEQKEEEFFLVIEQKQGYSYEEMERYKIPLEEKEEAFKEKLKEWIKLIENS